MADATKKEDKKDKKKDKKAKHKSDETFEEVKMPGSASGSGANTHA